MKQKLLLVLLLLITIIKGYSQILKPSFADYFSWKDRFGSEAEYDNYISSAKDQGEQGPCFVFSSVAAIEALSQIYYNKILTSNELNLSESEVYSDCAGYGCTSGVPNNENTFNYVQYSGIVNEDCYSYPDSSPYCRTDCNQTMCPNPDYIVYIPGYQQLYLNTIQQLKRAIIDYGPIVATLDKCGTELHGSAIDNMHSFLIIGWNADGEWEIKDSWPGEEGFYEVDINVFAPEYKAIFYRVKYESGGNTISCIGSGCNSIFSSRSYTDEDEDGFYYWGIGDKPSGCPGPCEMDFNEPTLQPSFWTMIIFSG